MSRPARRVLWVVNQFYWPDVAATAQLLTDLSEDAASAGWDVRAVAGTSSYVPGARGRRAAHERHAGVRIRRLATLGPGRSLLVRACSYAGFLGAALLHLLRVRRGDVVLTLSTPPFVALVGLLARRRGARFVYKVEDLYPDVALALGTLSPGAVAGLLARLSAHLLRRADAVVVLDEGMRRSVQARRGHGVGLAVIPNWADEAALYPMPSRSSRTRQALGLPAETLVLGYAGNFGRAHRFDALLEALEGAAREHLPLHALVSGDGAEAQRLRAAAARLPNLTVRGYAPRSELGDLLAASDVHVVSLRPEVEGLLFPSKLAGVLAAGRPVLALSGPQGALAEEVRTGDLGWTAPHEPGAVLAALRSIAAERASLPSRGARARAWFEAHYRRSVQRERWLALLERCRTETPGSAA